MTLVLSEVGSLLTAAAVWFAVAVALAAAAGFVVTRRGAIRTPALRVAVTGGLLAAGLSSRLGLSDPAGFEIWGRPLPPLWVLGGAVVGVTVVQWRRNRVSDRGEGSVASPAPGAARP